MLAGEANPTAASDLEFNLREAGVGNVRVIAESVEKAIDKGELGKQRADAIVLDPPRTISVPPSVARRFLGAPRDPVKGKGVETRAAAGPAPPSVP